METKYSVENHGLGRALKYGGCSPVNQSNLPLLIIGSPTTLQLSANKYKKPQNFLLSQKTKLSQNISDNLNMEITCIL
jgi:hypothetical protein